MIRRVVLYGERCSGTNYLEQLLLANFDVEIVSGYGHKHFFGFHNLENSDDVLFIGIVRNLHDWIGSLYHHRHHLPPDLCRDATTFLSHEFYSVDEEGREIMTDRNLETGGRYRNIFEMRHVKNRFLVESMPGLVRHYRLITYEDLLRDLRGIMSSLSSLLRTRPGIEFPVNIPYYKDQKDTPFHKKTYHDFDPRDIHRRADPRYEKMLYPDFDADEPMRFVRNRKIGGRRNRP